MFRQRPILAPLLNTEAGLCLTAANWQDAGIDWLVYELHELLHKPGILLLEKLSSLASYLGWGGKIILNASHLKANREGLYKIKSPYDGSTLIFDDTQLKHLIEKLQPDIVVLPKTFTTLDHDWPGTIVPFVHYVNEEKISSNLDFGIYCSVAEYETNNLIPKSKPMYLMEVNSREQILQLLDEPVQFIETNQPAQDAFAGVLYHENGVLDITAIAHEFNDQPIASGCDCNTCRAHFTPAYLHHLHVHTPLLCQRLLIQHNMRWVANYLKGDKLIA